MRSFIHILSFNLLSQWEAHNVYFRPEIFLHLMLYLSSQTLLMYAAHKKVCEYQ